MGQGPLQPQSNLTWSVKAESYEMEKTRSVRSFCCGKMAGEYAPSQQTKIFVCIFLGFMGFCFIFYFLIVIE